ncbi:MAG: hypothetical protein ACO266_08245, partial [Steroidobacteraceae bacterium]
MAGLTLPLRAALTVIALGGFPSALLAADTAPSEPLQIFARFKSALEANDLATAGQRAEELVAITEAQRGKDSRELVNPLTNLGTVQFR